MVSLPQGFTAAVLLATSSAVVLNAPAYAAPTLHERNSDRLAATQLDAGRFFDMLRQRYRSLTSYSDISHIVHIIRLAGQSESHRIETEVTCEISDGTLRVHSPSSQLRQSLGLNLPLPLSQPLRETDVRYKLWLLPHMSLRFSDEPLEEFRSGTGSGFTPTDLGPADRRSRLDRPLMRLELRRDGDVSRHSEATFDLYVDPESMLIERVHGQQRLPDGGSFETTVDITPERVEPTRDSLNQPSPYPDWTMRSRDGAIPSGSRVRGNEVDSDRTHDAEAPRDPWVRPAENPAPQSDSPPADPGAEGDPSPTPAPAPAPEPQPTPEPEPEPQPDPYPSNSGSTSGSTSADAGHMPASVDNLPTAERSRF